MQSCRISLVVTFNDKWRVFFSAIRRSTRVLRIDFIASEIGVQVATEQKIYTRSPSGRADAPTFGPHASSRGALQRASLLNLAISGAF